MNSLTKVLLEDLLEAGKKKVTAIYGGGFKPPTKGHFDVIQKATEQNPEIDEFIIYVGSGTRDGIGQAESIMIWELYKKYLPLKVRVEPVKAPVGDILRYAKEHPEEEVLWIIGARENNPEDFMDIASRTRTLDKYPNLQLRVIQTSGGVSGTAARKAVKDNNKEQFFHLIPDIEEKDQVWDVVSPIVKEIVTSTDIICDNCGWEWAIKDGGDDLYICHKCGHDNTPQSLNEGRYDSISRQLAKYTINGWKDDFENGEPTGRVEFEVGPGKDLEYGDLKFLYKGVAVFAGIQNYTHNGYAKGGLNSLVTQQAEVGVTYSIPKNMIPQGWEEVYMDLTSTIRHEIEHLTQFGTNVKQGKEMDSDWEERKQLNQEPNPVKYVTLPKEVDANVQGLYLKAKKWKRPYSEVVDEYIRDFMKITKPEDIAYVKGIYAKRAKELNLPTIQESKNNLNEGWNLQDAFVSLSKFMIDNGMNIKPLPKIKVIKDDEENASDLLGKTAYYNPNDKSITLFTMNRHPKDILRSFSHEMIHHEQNLNGKLNNINTTNTNEDGDLPEIEREAYEKGNMMLRNWEDNIKNV